ncbi:AAA-ATPase [Melia azedarach]|uniref:AAA-ATPase n=1 Tax=Melia azedarach TaxID=155640 RepID=A0ACC1XZ99_MELAZ|nr:AAA-ATPase [Melia azedarach]
MALWLTFTHPAIFDTLAMEAEQKKTIREDLERFVQRKHFYRRVGKAWKLGYLLYGPAGTGKSGLIAAMANYHIDCSLELQDPQKQSEGSQQAVKTSRQNKVTLSGLLNFIDGLWSNCGYERIIVFTTNHDRLEPALLRPGRMDVHINLSRTFVA